MRTTATSAINAAAIGEPPAWSGLPTARYALVLDDTNSQTFAPRLSEDFQPIPGTSQIVDELYCHISPPTTGGNTMAGSMFQACRAGWVCVPEVCGRCAATQRARTQAPLAEKRALGHISLSRVDFRWTTE
jgi:hypothetical protein